MSLICTINRLVSGTNAVYYQKSCERDNAAGIELYEIIAV